MTVPGTKQSSVNGRSMSAPPPNSDFNLFGYRQGIIYLDAKIAHRALDLAVAEKQLDRPKIPGLSIDHCRLGSS